MRRTFWHAAATILLVPTGGGPDPHGQATDPIGAYIGKSPEALRLGSERTRFPAIGEPVSEEWVTHQLRSGIAIFLWPAGRSDVLICLNPFSEKPLSGASLFCLRNKRGKAHREWVVELEATTPKAAARSHQGGLSLWLANRGYKLAARPTAAVEPWLEKRTGYAAYVYDFPPEGKPTELFWFIDEDGVSSRSLPLAVSPIPKTADQLRKAGKNPIRLPITWLEEKRMKKTKQKLHHPMPL